MRAVHVARRLDPERRARLTPFIDAHGGLSDHLRLDLIDGGGDGFCALIATDHRGVIGYAQLSAANDGAVLEVLGPSAEVNADLVRTAVDIGEGPVTWWTDAPHEALAAELGFHLDRTLYEMRRPLPAEARSELVTRAFRPGVDDRAWLDLNNRAFAGHGEQGGWTVETLAARRREPWFDANGFRIHEIDGRMAAFCWTKVHDDPPSGEIYAIAVDPDRHGRGLGRAMTLAGLDHLADRGLRRAHLYVDAANASAVRVYEQLGFEVARARFAYAGTFDH